MNTSDDNEASSQSPQGEWETDILRHVRESIAANAVEFDTRPLGVIASEMEAMRKAKFQQTSRPREPLLGGPRTSFERFESTLSGGKYAFRDSIFGR